MVQANRECISLVGGSGNRIGRVYIKVASLVLDRGLRMPSDETANRRPPGSLVKCQRSPMRAFKA